MKVLIGEISNSDLPKQLVEAIKVSKIRTLRHQSVIAVHKKLINLGVPADEFKAAAKERFPLSVYF